MVRRVKSMLYFGVSNLIIAAFLAAFLNWHPIQALVAFCALIVLAHWFGTTFGGPKVPSLERMRTRVIVSSVLVFAIAAAFVIPWLAGAMSEEVAVAMPASFSVTLAFIIPGPYIAETLGRLIVPD